MPSSSRQLLGLCASCARVARNSRMPRASGPAARSFSSRSSTRIQGQAAAVSASRSKPLPQSNATQRACISSSSVSMRAAVADSSQAQQAQSQREQMDSGAEARTQVPPSPPSYYALFPQTLPNGPPPAGPFHIDVRALRREFLQLQAASHPDFHHHAASSAEPASSPSSEDVDPRSRHSESRRKAEAVSAHINAAYKTLSSPLLRAQYLLHERFGVDLAGDEAAEMAAPDQDLLLTVLEAREAIEGAEAEEELEEVARENDARIAGSERALGEAFARDDVDAAKAEAIRLRYWVNIKESVDNWERGKPIVLQH